MGIPPGLGNYRKLQYQVAAKLPLRRVCKRVSAINSSGRFSFTSSLYDFFVGNPPLHDFLFFPHPPPTLF